MKDFSRLDISQSEAIQRATQDALHHGATLPTNPVNLAAKFHRDRSKHLPKHPARLPFEVMKFIVFIDGHFRYFFNVFAK